MQYFKQGFSPITNLTLWDSSSRVLLNGLSACDDITQNYWNDHAIALAETEDAPVILLDDSARANMNISNHVFEKPGWMCRNRTLSNAIEDLAGNITIGMLSSSNLT